MSQAPVATEHMRIPGSEPPNGLVLVSEGCAVAWALSVWVTCAATGVMVASRPDLPLRNMSGSRILLQPGMSELPATVYDHVDAQDLGPS